MSDRRRPNYRLRLLFICPSANVEGGASFAASCRSHYRALCHSQRVKRRLKLLKRLCKTGMVVPKPGVEPGYPYGRWYLKPVRLPVPPLRPEEWSRIIADQSKPVKTSPWKICMEAT